MTHQVSEYARQMSNITAPNDLVIQQGPGETPGWECTVLPEYFVLEWKVVHFNLRIFFLKVLETLCYGLDAKYLLQDQLVVLFQEIAECMRGVS